MQAAQEKPSLCQPRKYKGITFITFDDLSDHELQMLTGHEFGGSVKPFETISILINGVVIQNCIQYKDYLRWRKSQ